MKINEKIDLQTDDVEINVEYNDYQGGDAGHGGFLNIDINFSKNGLYEIEPRKIRIESRGDWEKQAIVESIIKLAEILKPLTK